MLRKLTRISALILALCCIAVSCSAPEGGGAPSSEVTASTEQNAEASVVASSSEPTEAAAPSASDETQAEHTEAASRLDELPTGQKALVVYFSETGQTKTAAESIAAAIGADLFEIRAANPYTEEDLNRNESGGRSFTEQGDAESRPEIVEEPANIRQYDVIYLGYPLWWGEPPRIIYTFLEANDLSGMKVVPFCTSDNAGIEQSAATLKADFPDIDWQQGMRIPDPSGEANMAEWSEELGFWPFGD